TFRNRARGFGVECEKLFQRQRVLIVVELRAGEASLRADEPFRISVRELKVELIARHLRHQQSFQTPIRRKTEHSAVRQQIFARKLPMPGKFRDCRQLDSTSTDRAEVLSLSRDERRCRGKRDVRNGVIYLIPEKVTAHKQMVAKRLHAQSSVTARQPLGAQRSIRTRYNIADAKISIELVERRRAKRAIRGGIHGDAAIESLGHRHARTKRRLRPVRKVVQRRHTRHRNAIGKPATVAPVIKTCARTKQPRSDAYRITPKQTKRSLPASGIDESRDSRIVERSLRAVSTNITSFDARGERLISDWSAPLKCKPQLLRWIALAVGQRLKSATRSDGREVLIEVL